MGVDAMGARSWKAEREELADKIRRSLNLEDDTIIDEVLTSENKQEAIRRVQDIERDAQIALRVLTIKRFPFPRGR
jgi:hypothetical protein